MEVTYSHNDGTGFVNGPESVLNLLPYITSCTLKKIQHPCIIKSPENVRNNRKAGQSKPISNIRLK